MTSKEAFKKILKLIVCGKIPKELYNEYLGDTEIGFMSFEELETYFSEPQPTLSECIKEWEERGWKTSYICDGINLSKLNDGIEEYFYFDKDLKRIDCNCFISFDLIPLIHKTLKALEEMKDE